MPDAPDLARLITGHGRVIEMINDGRSGLPVLEELLVTAQAALGADGMSLAEFTSDGGRIVAATGRAGYSLGRPVDAQFAEGALRMDGRRTGEVSIRAIGGEPASQLEGRGLRRLLWGRCVVRGMVVGTLQAFYADPAHAITPEHHTVLGYVASCIAHTYGDAAGLPVHGDGPVVDALADGLAVVDSGTVRLWNPAAERLTGRPAPEVLGRRLPLPLPHTGQAIDHQLPNGRWLKITSGELLGSTDSVVVTFRDATDQHRRDHDRDLFIAVASHELRTPVTVIKGYADTLVNHWDHLDEAGRRGAANVLGQRAGELAKLVDRLLSVDNSAGPVGGSEPVPFDLVDALRAAADALPHDLRRRLTVDLPPDLTKAYGDRGTLTTVLTELATNAGKYSPGDGPIDLTAGADPRSVWFRVSDCGIGVRPEHVELAFDRYWQGERGDRRQYSGTGLGLYLVRRIVERQKGWVSLRPRDGGGTVAEVRLPRADAPAADVGATVEHETGE
ncbi:sensor histidine kinase [Rhizomonospora bruguierae]|uniref:sensor histidine kinase n=1 Tax=Rhizomonospora bruguierae TaxID=1581705 RepID=UPI001BCA683A|nr:ATP-binding protein [Micromonospora sp. NBRC 107566]